MPRFGCCLAIASFVPQIGAAQMDESAILTAASRGLESVAAAGFDFAELTVGTLMQLSPSSFDRLCRIVEAAGVKVPAANSFIPGHLALTGPSVSMGPITDYVREAFSRTAKLGVHTIVFGSGKARSYPEGFDPAKAREQLLEFLRLCARYAEESHVTLVIEPLNRGESNVITSVVEAVRYAQTVASPAVQVLADSYHMATDNEAFTAVTEAAGRLRHVHVADRDRSAPGTRAETTLDYATLFRALAAIHYAGDISMECRFDQFEQEAPSSLQFIRRTWEEAAS